MLDKITITGIIYIYIDIFFFLHIIVNKVFISFLMLKKNVTISIRNHEMINHVKQFV